MSLRNRYLFLKRMYPDTMIIFIKKNNCFCVDEDRLIYKYFNKSIKQLSLNNIDYIVINNLDIIDKLFNDNNYYEKFYKIALVNKFMNSNLYNLKNKNQSH